MKSFRFLFQNYSNLPQKSIVEKDEIEIQNSIDWLIIPSLSTGGPYPQQRWSEET